MTAHNLEGLHSSQLWAVVDRPYIGESRLQLLCRPEYVCVFMKQPTKELPPLRGSIW
jgi:hypothetical protein